MYSDRLWRAAALSYKTFFLRAPTGSNVRLIRTRSLLWKVKTTNTGFLMLLSAYY